jgi:hypothetical protein
MGNKNLRVQKYWVGSTQERGLMGSFWGSVVVEEAGQQS